ncbi:MAG: hypothetical protein LBD29_01945 [Treponema sp.]|jgi:hypothetical protein|nr:hypothetical protein [Treponema sp.]
MVSNLSPLQKEIVSWIIAVNEDNEPPKGDGAYVMQAFQGGFIRGLPYTCFMPVANKVLLYVYEEGANNSLIPRGLFKKNCEPIKKALLEAAYFINDCLMAEDYVRILDKPQTAQWIEENARFWRRYEDFYPKEIENLKFVCTHWFIPKAKLYKFQKLV